MLGRVKSKARWYACTLLEVLANIQKSFHRRRDKHELLCRAIKAANQQKVLFNESGKWPDWQLAKFWRTEEPPKHYLELNGLQWRSPRRRSSSSSTWCGKKHKGGVRPYKTCKELESLEFTKLMFRRRWNRKSGSSMNEWKVPEWIPEKKTRQKKYCQKIVWSW